MKFLALWRREAKTSGFIRRGNSEELEFWFPKDDNKITIALTYEGTPAAGRQGRTGLQSTLTEAGNGPSATIFSQRQSVLAGAGN